MGTFNLEELQACADVAEQRSRRAVALYQALRARLRELATGDEPVSRDEMENLFQLVDGCALVAAGGLTAAGAVARMVESPGTRIPSGALKRSDVARTPRKPPRRIERNTTAQRIGNGGGQ